MSMTDKLHLGFLVFPDLLQLDLAGPYGVLAAAAQARGGRVSLIWKDTRPLRSSDKLIITPTLSLGDCPQLDVLCVPGGGGIAALLNDEEALDFLRAQAGGARYLASICTGALVLGAAGLLRGCKATTHWQSFHLLPLFGIVPVRQRVVRDGNRITSAGVSAGIDMALYLAALLWGEDAAREIQLGLEYAPEPPFADGSPETANPELLGRLREKNAARQAMREAAALEAAERLEFP